MTLATSSRSSPPLYCTYFDSEFLARGIAMLRSLNRASPEARLIVLALDDLCARVLRDSFAGNLRVVEVDQLHAAAPVLRKIREQRSAWAYYATQKAAFALLAMETDPRPHALMYIDADTYFFSDPTPMFDEIGPASVGLSPHRFCTPLQHLAIYGAYNAGCLYWRNDETSRRCLAEWHNDCIEWCAEQAQPDGRFMNQGYLNLWPARYAGVHILQHPGANLAPWNVDAHRLARDGSGVTVDGERLIFYHFSGLSRDAEGHWHSHYPRFERNFDLVCEAIYQPHLRAVENESQRLQAFYGIDGSGSRRSLSEWPPVVQVFPRV